MSSRAADTALWAALEERRDEIKAAGLEFSERQHNQLREHAARGDLIATFNAAGEQFAAGGTPDPYYLRPMAEAIKNGLPTLEHIFLEKGTPWRPYVTPAARRGSQNVIADATAYIPYL